MKKLLLSLAVVAVSFAAVAQTPAKKEAAKKETAAKEKEDVKTNKGSTIQPKTEDGKMKKDGTPDMRYKENKEAAKPAGPLKKDGTPDMRHKANKDAAKK